MIILLNNANQVITIHVVTIIYGLVVLFGDMLTFILFLTIHAYICADMHVYLYTYIVYVYI